MADSRLNGRWLLVQNQGLQEYSKAIGADEEYVKIVHKINEPRDLVKEIKLDSQKVSIRNYIGRDLFTEEPNRKIGKEFRTYSPDGRYGLMSVVTFQGGKLKERQSGLYDGYTETWIENGELFISMTCGKAKCLQHFQRLLPPLTTVLKSEPEPEISELPEI